MTREELESKMSVLLGGRAAEEIVFEHLSTGASDDLNRVTEIARSMVTRYGMVPELGHVTYDTERAGFLGSAALGGVQRPYSDDTAREIDAAVRAIVARCYERAKDLLSRNRALLEESAKLLLVRETLDETDLAPLFGRIVSPARVSG